MRRTVSARHRLLIAGVIVGVVGAIPLISTYAAPRPGVARQPGEAVLSRAQMDKALQGMSPAERERRAERWADPANLPVAYGRAYFKFVRDRAGKLVPMQIGGYEPGTESSNLRLPSLDTAATSGSGSRYDLYISVAVVRQTCSGCYQWAIDNWADWRGTSGNGINLAEDSFGTSWAGDLYLHHDTYTGKYMPLGDGTVRNLDIYRSDATPNEGVGWSFHEWWRPCGQCTGTYANWADGTAYIRENSWKSRTDNVINKYFHTTNTGDTYSLTFYNAGISITPASNQWSVAAYASFSH